MSKLRLTDQKTFSALPRHIEKTLKWSSANVCQTSNSILLSFFVRIFIFADKNLTCVSIWLKHTRNFLFLHEKQMLMLECLYPLISIHFYANKNIYPSYLNIFWSFIESIPYFFYLLSLKKFHLVVKIVIFLYHFTCDLLI